MPESEGLENELLQESEGTEYPAEPSAETAEMVGVSETLFVERMDSLENLLLVTVIGVAIIAGCILASVVLRFFHVH